ncbi:hypothetical protein ACM26W_09475 [Halomonas sp. HK25]|uniref:hypothetical protein n=1 Tax=Halomonas sp. HK25 TaxID=3394321 RepID=UPI0039FDBE2A
MIDLLLLKLLATSTIVVGVALAVGKLGPRLGGILAGMPVILGPGYFFMLQEQPAPFVQDGVLATLHDGGSAALGGGLPAVAGCLGRRQHVALHGQPLARPPALSLTGASRPTALNQGAPLQRRGGARGLVVEPRHGPQHAGQAAHFLTLDTQ